MFRRLRTIVPCIQLLAAVIVFSLPKLCHNSRLYENYQTDIQNLQNLVLELNLPLAALWIVVFSPVTWLSTYAPFLKGTPPPAITIPVAIVLTSSVALFWYIVVTEVEMRRHGRSMLRFSGWLKEGIILIVLLSFGIGSALYGYTESRPLWYARPMDAALVGLFPAIWGIVFIGMAIHDLAMSLKNRTRQSTGGSR